MICLAAAVLLVPVTLIGTSDGARWVMAALFLLVGWSGIRRETITFDRLDFFLLLPMIWAIFSAYRSPDPNSAALVMLHMTAALLIVYWFRKANFPCDAKNVSLFASAVLAALFVLAFIEPTRHGGYGNENFLVEIELALTGPAMLGLAILSGPMRMIPVAVALMAIHHFVFINVSNFEWLALPVIAAVALPLALWPTRPKARLIAWAGLAFVGLAFFACIAADLPIRSVGTRAGLWLNTAELIRSAPWTGHGTGSFEWLYPLVQDKWHGIGPVVFLIGGFTTVGAAHNELLQTIAEYGLTGLVLALCPLSIVLVAFLRHKRPSTLEIAALLALAGLLVPAMIEFPLQKPATIFVAAAAFGILSRRAGRTPRLVIDGAPAKLAAIVAPLAAFLLLIVFLFHFLALVEFNKARHYTQLNPKLAFERHLAATDLFPLDARIRMRLMHTYSKWHLSTLYIDGTDAHNPLLAPVTAERVYHMSADAMPMYSEPHLLWVRYLDMSGLWRARKDEIEEILSRFTAQTPFDPAVWLAEAIHASVIGDTARLQKAVETGLALPNVSADQRDNFKRLRP